MHGNVWEWCWDWKGDYPGGAVTDPTGPAAGSDRAYRGGSWFSDARYTRAAYRSDCDPGDRDYYLGLRPARSTLALEPWNTWLHRGWAVGRRSVASERGRHEASRPGATGAQRRRRESLVSLDIGDVRLDDDAWS